MPFPLFSVCGKKTSISLMILAQVAMLLLLLLLLFGRYVAFSSSAVPKTVAHRPHLSIRFLRQEYWTGLLFPCLRNLPDPGMEPKSPALAGVFFTTEPPGGIYVHMNLAVWTWKDTYNFWLKKFKWIYSCFSPMIKWVWTSQRWKIILNMLIIFFIIEGILIISSLLLFKKYRLEEWYFTVFSSLSRKKSQSQFFSG